MSQGDMTWGVWRRGVGIPIRMPIPISILGLALVEELRVLRSETAVVSVVYLLPD